MNKSVYSLVLMDEVVEAIDKMAYAMNTSRSNLINQILADYASCTTPESRMMLTLEQMGAATLNLVTGSHFIPSITEALDKAKGEGFSLPVVWNSSGYESLEGLALIDPYIDLYLVDVKTCDKAVARVFCGKEAYVDAIWPVMDFITSRHPHTDVEALSGTLVRHLVFPGTIAATRRFLKRFARDYKDSCALSLMVQFIPPKGDVDFPPMGDEDYDRLIDLLEELDTFFRLWSRLEAGYLGGLFPGGQIPSQISEGRFWRQFLLPREQDRQTNDQVAQAIADYLCLFDQGMKTYFQYSADLPTAAARLESLYRARLKAGMTVI